MAELRELTVPMPAGGWGMPWPNVAEIEAVLPHTSWTLVGGLMAQLHASYRGIDTIRPTNDVDIVLHVETAHGIAGCAARALESLGYSMRTSISPRERTAHRFVRGGEKVDLVTAGTDVVDVLVADHAAPSVVERLRGRDMVAIEGGTQALRRTVNATLSISDRRPTTVSVPDAFGALILKAAAYRADSRDPARHLQDAAVLLCCIEDPFVERERFAGSDARRIQALVRAMPETARSWGVLSAEVRREGQAALRVLAG